MIRQAISCDICGAEKKQTNHWFVAWEQAGELRVSGWNSRNRLRAGARHLCGQVCLHKLADDFMAREIAGKSPRGSQAAGQTVAEIPVACTASGSAAPESVEVASTARLLPTAQILPRRLFQTEQGIASVPDSAPPDPPLDDAPRFAERNWRAGAWERERQRTQRADHRPQIVPRRMVGTRD